MQIKISLNPSWQREFTSSDRRFWLLRAVALRIEIRANPLWVLEVYWKRLLVAGSLLLVMGYLVLATGFWYAWRQNPQNLITWSDVALAPVRWEELKRKRGDTSIATAIARIKQRDFTEAFYSLKIGLVRSPGNTEGRLLLARMLAMQDPVQSLSLLEEGLHYSPGNLELLQTLFATYSAQQAVTRALAQAEQLYAPGYTPPLSAESKFFVGVMRASLLTEAKRLPEAERALEEIRSVALSADNQSAWHRLKVDVLIRRGQLTEAKTWLHDHFTENSTRLDELRITAELALALADEESLAVALRRLKLQSPDLVGARLYALRTWHRAGNAMRMKAELEEYFRLFSTDDNALQALAATAVILEQPEIIRRASRVAAASRLSTFAYQVHLTELSLREGNAEGAFRQLPEWEPRLQTLKPEQLFYPLFISRLVRSCQNGEQGQSRLLLSALADGRGQAQSSIYLLAVDSLERSGRIPVARDVATAGLRLYPACDRLREVDLRLARIASESDVAKLNTAKDSGPALPTTREDALLRIDDYLAADKPDQARQLMHAVREFKPDWVEQSSAAFELRDIALDLQAGDQMTARNRLTGYISHNQAVGELLPIVVMARGQLVRNHPAEARLLHDVLAAHSGLPVAVIEANNALKFPDEVDAPVATPAAVLAELDASLAGHKTNEAERRLNYLRERHPAWVTENHIVFAVREVQVRLLMDQRPLAITLLKELVVPGGAARSGAFKLVRDLKARGELENARLLAQEVVRLLPDDAAAAKLLRETEAATPAG